VDSLDKSVAVVVPCFNEADLDAHAFVAFRRAHPRVHFLFVNDGSTDETQTVLEKLCAEDREGCSLIAMPKNVGKAEAVRTGMRSAIERGYGIVGYWDADLAIPLADMPGFLRALEKPEVEIVTGARVKLFQVNIDRQMGRHISARTLATMVEILFGLGMYETQCGAKLFRVTPFLKESLQTSFTSRWLFDIELLVRIRHFRKLRADRSAAGTVHEYPLSSCIDTKKSTIRLFDCFKMPIELLKIRSRWKTGLQNDFNS
jgi:glycosyltransferase involved in cell wall biosynthesis